MAFSVDLAQELIDHILDFLHDDRGSLLSSSLVARQWVPAPRYHIFERITINRYFTAGHHFRETTQNFLSICASPHCTILPSVQSVILNINTELGPASVGLLEDIVHVLARAPVKKMLFVDHNSMVQPVSLSWIAPFFPGLQEFVYNALYRVAEDIFVLVTSFPILRILSVYSRTPDPSSAEIVPTRLYPAIPHAVFAHLHTLRMKLSTHDSVLSWLQSTELRPLETLDLHLFNPYHNGWGPVAALNSLLHANGEHLRHLTLRVSNEDSSDETIDDLVRQLRVADGEVDLSGLTNLRSLRLHVHSAASTPPLEALEVDFARWIYYGILPCTCDPQILLPEFSAVMGHDQFAGLTAFDIRVPDIFGDSGRNALREFFPRWKDTQVLRVGYVESASPQVDSWETAEDFDARFN
ncbi:hypothetical protein B0H17DRAFT_1102161 [Mycena rosella]|uniref:Uncharacterized protein n=1 Tax=Mycena rosella TaxID=1033263 RepID=A0AAD7CHQ5_MYCRO|nr:hypothetical protein B0H17DRAFT_1102161 [Mycena rosella]